ncbi:MAG: DNA internalization-related competence protein ComEC/Rec2 [bacterium]
MSYVGGALFGWFFPQAREALWVCLAVFGLLALAAVVALGRPLPRAALLVCAVFALSAFRTSVRIDPVFPADHLTRLASGKPVLLEGVLWDEPVLGADSTQLPFRATFLRREGGVGSVQGKADLYVPGVLPELRIGDVLIVEARLQRIRNLGNPGEFDKVKRSHLRGVYVRGSVKEPARVLTVGRAGGYGTLGAIQDVRLRLRAFFKTVPDPESRALLLALIVGDRTELTEGLQDSFRESGLAHLISISGLHVSLVGLFVYGIVKTALKRSQRILLRGWLRKLSAALSLPPVLSYVLIAGSPITALRAGLMALCFTGALVLDRPAAAWNTLGAAALFLLVSDPAALFSISFLLSFVAVAAILAVTPFMPRSGIMEGAAGSGVPGRLIRLFQSFLHSSLLVSLAAGLATFPLCARFFHQVSLIGVLANLPVVPFVGWLVMPLGLLAALCSIVCPPLAPAVLEWAAGATGVSIRMVEFFAAVPCSAVRVGAPTVLEMLLLYGSFWFALDARRSGWRRRCAAICLVGVAVSAGSTVLSRRTSRDLEVTFLAVGQGDGTLVVLPGGKKLLVDGGMAAEGFSDAGRRVVGPFLGASRISKLDWIAASHGHPDHYGGLRFVAEALRPREIWIGPPTAGDPLDYQEFLISCDRLGVRRRVLCDELEPFSLNGVTVEVLNPSCPGGGEDEGARAATGDPNNLSLVLRLTYGAVSFLLTGDIERTVEDRLLRNPDGLRALVIKVPHHGSRGSSGAAFLEAVSPGVAVVSAGFGNRFGFPSGEVVRRYAEQGALMYRTDLEGAVRMRTDGKTLEVQPYRGAKRCFSVPQVQGEVSGVRH